MMDMPVLAALVPIILLLLLGVFAAILSRQARVSPIVGYLVLGFVLKAAGITIVQDSGTVRLLAELGVVFLLFDIGLSFSLAHIRRELADIFGFGPLQILLGTLGLGLAAWAVGLAPLPAFLVGATLALSSTAVVAPLIAERRQQNCPVGLTATAILVFQDVAAIFLLIIAGAMGGGALLPLAGLALLKAGAAFAMAVVFARTIVRPLFATVARNGQEEVFTAIALLIALAAGWATGQIGLSLTLGAFLGGMTVAETPYRAIVHSEIKPFRGLLLGFFFIWVGLSLDVTTLTRHWPLVITVAIVLVAVKVFTNALASLAFRWSVPGSLQLGFMLAQGSEFAFVLLSLPAVRKAVGVGHVSIITAAVALTLAATPSLAAAGRIVAGRLRKPGLLALDPELVMRERPAPVLIVGMGHIGRTLADALTEFGIGYTAIEHDYERLSHAVADGYSAIFGNASDPRFWEPMAVSVRKISALTSPSFEIHSELTPVLRRQYPNLLRYAAVVDDEDAARFIALDIRAIVDRATPPGLDLAGAVLRELEIDPDEVADWMQKQQARHVGGAGAAFNVA
jgi:CPA2 family monovalent cation:H+ antiporter-2